MKAKILLPLVIVFLASTAANAQVTEGRFLLGGSIGYTHQDDAQNSNSKYNAFYSNVQFGKVIKDNTVIGIIGSYGFSNNELNDNKSNQYNAGLFYRKYKLLTKNFYFFGELDALYSHSQNETNFKIGSNGTRYSSNGGTVAFVPGLAYSICKRMQLELSMPNLATISYAGTKNETTSTSTNSISTTTGNNFSANANLNANLLSNFGIGFKFFLGK